MPADGEVVEGTSYVDESMLTGESGGCRQGRAGWMSGVHERACTWGSAWGRRSAWQKGCSCLPLSWHSPPHLGIFLRGPCEM